MAIYELNVGVFRSKFPQYADVTAYPDELITNSFTVAESLVNNTNSSNIPYDPTHNIYTRGNILEYLTCHLITLSELPNSQTGRIASASQGSVSTSFDLPKTNSVTGDWYNQTRCGQLVWILLAPYRLGGRIYNTSTYHPWG